MLKVGVLLLLTLAILVLAFKDVPSGLTFFKFGLSSLVGECESAVDSDCKIFIVIEHLQSF